MCWIFVKRTNLRVCWRSTIDLCLMKLPKRSSFKSLLKAYTLSKILLWIKNSYFSLENACYSWCMHQTGMFSLASVVPQSKFTGELWSSASVVPQSKSTEMWSSAAPFHHDLWYFRHWTNEHFSCMLFIRKKTWPAHSSATQATEINTLDQITGQVIDVSRTHIPLKALMIPLKGVKLSVVV